MAILERRVQQVKKGDVLALVDALEADGASFLDWRARQGPTVAAALAGGVAPGASPSSVASTARWPISPAA